MHHTRIKSPARSHTGTGSASITDTAIPTLGALGRLAEDVMGRALDGVDDATVEAILGGLATIKANLKSELNPGASDK